MKYLKLFEQYLNDNFWNWFGDSKIVDSNGNPLKVYHGTSNNFSEFPSDTKGIRTNHEKEDVGYHFTDSPDYADVYASTADMNMYLTYVKYWPNEEEKARHNIRNSNIMPVYLKIEKPYHLQHARIDKHIINDAISKGCDGIIAGSGEPWFEYVVFKPNQIKSAIGNNGLFSIDSNSITEKYR